MEEKVENYLTTTEENYLSEWHIGYVQEYIQEPNAKDDEVTLEERRNRSDEFKNAIQKAFINYQILGFDSIKPLLEDTEIGKIYESLPDDESRKKFTDKVRDSINEVKESVAVEFRLIKKRKKAHELLLEHLDDKYGEAGIDSNINRVINKNAPYTGDDEDDSKKEN